MKKVFLLLSLISVFVVNSQNLNYQKELERMVKIPNTPEAQAFTKYGNTSVSMYSGTPNVSIPIYTISGRELDLPISLSYDASGVKVAQLAGQAGLSWNLNAGGRISRTINGLVDDYTWKSGGPDYPSVYSTALIPVYGTNEFGNSISQSKTLYNWIDGYLTPPQTFANRNDGIIYFNFLKDISLSKIDVQPDYFSFNALGYSDHFVFDLKKGEFKSLDNPRTKVDVSIIGGIIDSWIVTVENGTKFYFEQAEKTKTVNLNDYDGTSMIYQEYYSSWLLTKIQSPNLKDIYLLDYNLNLGLSNTQPNIAVMSFTNELSEPNPETTGNTTTQNTTYHVSQLPLVKVTHNNNKIVDLTLKSRYDISLNSAIDNITIYKNDAISVLKKYTFNHSYFGITSGTNPAMQDPFSIRLKLDSISIQSASNINLSSYAFEYYSPENVPYRGTYSQDYLGLYNGKSNSVLYPEVTINGTIFPGADRSADFTYAIKGTLSKLTYPTGGFTDFIYESMKTPFTTEDIITTTQDVTYGTLSLVGGIGNSADSGFCALDQYGVYPKISASTFNIVEAGTYDINYSNSSGGGEAYLFQKTGTAVIPYNQVIDQSNCNELVTMSWAQYLAGSANSVYLTPGTYQITLAKGQYFSGDGIISLSVHREETTTSTVVNTGEVERAGIRIKIIKDYSAALILSSEKEYQYVTALNGSDSSGEILFDPEFYTTSTYQVYITIPDPNKNQVSGLNTLTRMTRGTSWSGGDRPHVAYAKVFEIQKASGLNNGYIEHNFNTGWYNGVFSTGVSPGANLYLNNFNTGKESHANTYKADNTLLNTNSTGYFDTQFNNDPQYFESSSIYLHNIIGNTYSYVNIRPNGSGGFYVTYDPAYFTALGEPSPGQTLNAAPPPTCASPNFCMTTLDYSSLGTLQTYAQGNFGAVGSKTNTSYYNGIANTKTTSNTYDAAIDYLLRDTQTITSEGDTLLTKQYYPKDYTTAPYTTMVSNNRFTDVIKTETYKNGNKLFTRENPYLNTGLGIFPYVVLTAKGGNTPEARINYLYSGGNVVDASQFTLDGTETHISYIWGYDGTLPIAKLENVKYADIPGWIISTLQGMSTSSFEINEGTEQDLRDELFDLRSEFPNALITTYTYDPHIGVKSITDPRGQTVYFHYDQFNRLEYVTDNDGKVLSKNQYNFRTN